MPKSNDVFLYFVMLFRCQYSGNNYHTNSSQSLLETSINTVLLIDCHHRYMYDFGHNVRMVIIKY